LISCHSNVDPIDPIEPTEGFLQRQAEYLRQCFDHSGPGEGGIHGQVCRVYGGAETFNEEVIYEKLDKIDRREDTSDFDLNSVLRMLYLNRDSDALPDSLRHALADTVLNFKYWLDEPGPDDLCWWSENHQILFHTAELLAGQLYPDTVFPNSGLTGEEHVEHAKPLIRRWLDFRGRFGFSEWHSNVYFNEDMPPLVNLVDFAEDKSIRTRAAMVLDVLAFDMACNYYKGLFATTRGRTYPSKLLGGLNDSTREAAYILLGLGNYANTDNFTGAFLATSERYVPPPLLEGIAREAAEGIEHRQRDGIDLADGPKYGLGYMSHEDVMFWWGATGYAAPEVILGTFRMVEDFNLWEGFLWSGLTFLRPLVGSPLLPAVTGFYEELSRGVALESINTYTYRTPLYQLSGAQAFKPGSWTAQVHIWQATIDREAYVFTTYPGGLEDDYAGGPWTGGFVPRATFYKNVGIIQYRRPRMPILDELLFTDYSHAYFPRSAFDEIVEANDWVLGRKGDAFVALYSQHPTYWAQENNYELIADVKENIWIVELSDTATSGPFEQFTEDILSAQINIGGTVRYNSPSRGLMTVGWEGPFHVEGEDVDLGPYRRWDNPYCMQEFDHHKTDIRFEDHKLELNFKGGTRRYWTDWP